MADIYCGISNIPKGQRRGSMKDCAEKGQVRYYGVKKIDSKILEASKDPKNKPNTRNKLLKKFAGLNGEIKKLSGDVQYKKNDKDRKEAEKLLANAKKERTKVVAELKKIEEIEKRKSSKKQKGGSKKGTRKGSKKGSKRGSRKGSKKGSRKGSKKGSKL